MSRVLATLALVALATTPLAAQEMTAALADDFERQRDNVLGMVDAMPESGLRTAPTEGVRDFAQQIEHVVQGNVGIIRSGYDRPVDIPERDPEVYLNSKEELKRFVNAGYDIVNEMVSSMTADEMTEDALLFGQATVQKWKLIQTAYEHAVWTLGATVPYLRLNGATPPGYNLIPGN
jgi:hypothetical protein